MLEKRAAESVQSHQQNPPPVIYISGRKIGFTSHGYGDDRGNLDWGEAGVLVW